MATLLFADLVGFTALGETNDPEVVGGLVGRVFARLAEEVARYEGTIEKFAGDALLAVFGVPTVHEDDAERAVRAALEMQAALSELAARTADGRPALQLRIGIETGEVLVDLARAATERDLFVTGDPVNTAARLQQAAAPDTVVVGPSVYAATRDTVDYEELPPAVLKGKALPVAAWRAVAVKARRGGRRSPLGLESPLVGRDEELALLKETVRRTVAEGRPHLVTVVGAAGVGKSRLSWELEKYLDGLPETFHWRKGRCLAYAQVSYSALADAAKVDAEIRDDDAPATAEARLVDRLAVLGAGERERVALEALLAIGPPNPGIGRDELFDGWRRWLELVARRAPLVLVLEDLHWADDGLLDVVEHVARWADGPILVLVLARHELLERRPTWGGGLPNAATIVLEPLAPDESAALIDGLVGTALPAALRERVVALADGNPLFAEELVRMFVDRGVLRFADGRWELASPVEELEVPGTVQAVLAARLDALPSPEKRLAQNASVVGRIFWDAVVAHLSRQGVPATGDLLRRLRVKELVVPREPSTLAGAAEFGFRHVLIRDVAYDSLPKRDRAALHLDVARWAETELADRLDEIIELVASHYLAALRFEEEFGADESRLGPIREATYRYGRRAGARAASLHQLATADRWLGVALEQARRLGLPVVERARLAEEYLVGSFGAVSATRAVEVIAEAIEGLSGLAHLEEADAELLARLRALDGFFLFNLGRVDEARAVLTGAITALEGGPPTAGRALLLSRLGWTFWRAGPVEDAIPILERSISEARASDADQVERWALHELGVTYAQLGDHARGLPLVRQSYEMARAAKDRLLLTRCYNNLPSTMLGNGSPLGEVLAIALEGLEVLRRSGDNGSIAWLAQSIADAFVDRGEILEAIPYYEEALDAAEAVDDAEKREIEVLNLATVRYYLGDEAAADEVDQHMRSLAAMSAEPQAEVFGPLWRAQRTWRSDPSAAIAILRAIVEPTTSYVTRQLGGRWLARMAFRSRATLDLEIGVRATEEVVRLSDGPVRALEGRWIRALASGSAEASVELEAVAAELEALGEHLPAADAWADAALAAARTGLDPDRALARAREVYAACHTFPLLGPLPETRWVDPTGDPALATT
ncbi:MAG TPA: adenylate/guanylate cyclase domain-containing protein [Candidatus Limnocylindrales bacterium]|nr:adenylate/guanylate cyclase domain-containing protein [Candidatus Limnocylindrales bacterium]